MRKYLACDMQYLPVGLRKQVNPYNAQAAALWGGTGLLGALFLVQVSAAGFSAVAAY